MKKIKLFAISVIFILSSFAQQTSLNDLVSITLPVGTEKLSKDQLQALVRVNSSYFQNLDRNKNKGDFYKINNMILQLNGARLNAPRKLEDIKKTFDEMARMGGTLATNYSSEIRTINNYRVLVIHNEGQKFASYSFYSINNSNTTALNGTLEYDKTDKAGRSKAAKTLDQILNSMKFK